MADFSLESDIAPLSTNYFGGGVNMLSGLESNPYLSDAAKSRLSNELFGGLSQIQQLREKNADTLANSRLRDIRTQASEIALRKARREEEQETAAAAALPTVANDLNAILDDQALTPADKQFKLGQWGVRNASLLNTSPHAATAYKSAAAAAGFLPDDKRLTPYQEEQLRIRKSEIERDVAGDKLKQEADAAEAQAKFLDRLKESRFRESTDEVGNKTTSDSFADPFMRDTAFDILYEFSPKEAEELDKKNASDREIYNAASRIRRQKLLKNQPTTPTVDTRSRFQ